MKTLKMKWTGLRPLIMHNGILADPIHPLSICIQKATQEKKRIKKDNFEELLEAEQKINRMEWEAGLYWNDELGPVIPSDNIERCVQLGAQKSKKGKDVQAAIICGNPEYKLNYPGPRTKDALFASGKFLLRKSVKIQQARVMRSRPMFPTDWWIEIDIDYDELIGRETLIKACEDAGSLVGLSDWRPKFGRFLVEVL